MSSSAIHRRIAHRWLLPLHRGVYAVGHTALRPEGFWLAAVLAGGPGAVLSHRSAAVAWGLRPGRPQRMEVTVRGSTGRGQRALDGHRCRLDAEDVTALRRVPITTPSRTLLDLAEVTPRRELTRAVERAIELDLFDRPALAQVIDRAVGRRGLKPLRAVLMKLEVDPIMVRSELEHLAVDLVGASGLPRPAVNARVGTYEVDLLWRAERVVVELDGYAFHRSPAAFERDRRRDADLHVAGYRVLRVTWRQLTTDPGWVVARIADVLRVASEAHSASRVAPRPR
jgi:hypothetical protein